jgi:hypothetical protein
VTIEAVSSSTVTFSTRGCAASKNPDECLLRSFTVPLSEVTSTQIAGAPTPVPMVPGATGNLFLSRTGFQATSSDGATIYGIEHVVFKWPECAAAPNRVLSPLTVMPTSIALRGHLEGEVELFDLELLGPEAAEAQDFVWNGAGFIELRLSARGAERLRVQAGSTEVTVWPTRITIQGSPAVDPGVMGEVDILDLELAGEDQHLAFTRPGAPITLSLTHDGVNAFHVTPELVAERNRNRGDLVSAKPSPSSSPGAR